MRGDLPVQGTSKMCTDDVSSSSENIAFVPAVQPAAGRGQRLSRSEDQPAFVSGQHLPHTDTAGKTHLRPLWICCESGSRLLYMYPQVCFVWDESTLMVPFVTDAEGTKPALRGGQLSI